MTPNRLGLLAVVTAAAVLGAMPLASVGKGVALRDAGDALRSVTAGVNQVVDETIARTDEALRRTRERTGGSASSKRATSPDPARQPPLHGVDPHAQGGVAIVDTNPSSERPLASDPDGGDSSEEALVGRARGEQVNGAYHGHITILGLLGQELGGVDTAPGETKNGPLQPLQASVLDPLCTSSAGATCLSVLTANSTTTDTSSTNDFAIARAAVLGLGVGAAESAGTISQTSDCQTATGSARTANVTSPGGGAVAQVANSTSESKSCRGAAPVVTNTSSVIGLGGTQVPIPAAGCASGTPDTVTGLPAILPIVCNADDVAGAAAVREALDVFVLQIGGTSLAKEATAASESVSVAPPAREATPAQCSDGNDNDGDDLVDADDPGCHSDGNPNNPDSYNPNDNNETNGPTRGSGDPQCSDNTDNDGDGLVDARDPGCHSDGNPNNPESYDPDDDSEGDGGGDDGGGGGGGGGDGAPTGGQTTDAGDLPFTGTDVIGLTLAGLLMLAGGLLLRRREGAHTAF